jgi:primary-amine oxidase
VEHPIWVTRYRDEEQTPADKYPRGGRANEGLPKYVGDQESIVDEDLVLWYTYGVMHTTRPEEWPIMNAHNTGFSLIPYNFLSQNSEMALKDKCP